MKEKNICKIFALAILFLSIASSCAFFFSNDEIDIQNNDGMEGYYTSSLGASIKVIADKDMFTNTQSTETVTYYKVLSEDRKEHYETDYMKIQDNIPTEDEAIQIAESFIMDNGGLPKDAYLERVEQGYMEKRNYKTDELIEKRPMETRVNYERKINGYDVIGPGDSIAISIGEDGKILGYMWTWRTLEEAGEIEILSSEEAITKLENGQLMEIPISPYANPLTIEEASIAYYSEVMGEYQQYYTPVWIFSGIDANGDSLHIAVDALAR